MKFQAIASLKNSKVVVTACLDKDFCRSLERAGYLEDNTLYPIETAYQLSRGRLLLEGCGTGWGCTLRLLHDFSIDLDMFTVYRDLRRKGRKPRLGFRPRTLLYEHNSKVHEVLVLSEGYVERLSKIIEWGRQAAADNHVPIIAVVDRTGIITYYEARASKSIQ
ncbi:MAG: hypothetical protein F7B17_01970 [Desulfurococcales archaeon]|nr:hypothetical protein [Desulfurococcales archaeon]